MVSLQISDHLRLEEIAMAGKTTIYNWLHADKRSGEDLYSYCRHGLEYHRKRLPPPLHAKGHQCYLKRGNSSASREATVVPPEGHQ